MQFPADAPAIPHGHPFLHKDGGVDYVYFADPCPLTRVRADPVSLMRLSRYETFTCMKEGSRLADRQVEAYGWKKNTPAVGPADQARLIRAGRRQAGNALLQLRGADSGKGGVAHRGPGYW